MLKDLLTSKEVSIYCFINEVDKIIYVGYGIETISSVFNTIKNIKGALQKDVGKVKFKVIETYDSMNRVYLKWRVQELYMEYKALGYKTYISYKPLDWKLYVGVGTGRGDNVSVQYKAIVKLRTSANIVYEVKRFDTIEEATEFVQGNTISTAVRLLQ